MDNASPGLADKKAFSIEEFCAMHGISRANYYNLRNEGKAPEEMQVGPRRVLISIEAAEAWRRRMTRKNPAALAD
jgi:predicted DNA-binding transcriptional regulator AlpA